MPVKMPVHLGHGFRKNIHPCLQFGHIFVIWAGIFDLETFFFKLGRCLQFGYIFVIWAGVFNLGTFL